MSRVPDPAELAEDLREIGNRLARMDEKLDQRYVPRELYEARHTALRSEVALEVARLERESRSAKQISMWALGVTASLGIGGVVAWLTQGGAG